MKRIILFITFLWGIIIAQTFDQLPPNEVFSDSAAVSVITEEEQQAYFQEINKRYRGYYNSLIERLQIRSKELEKRANIVKLVFIIASLLPAIGALINFINKKPVQITVSILAGLGVIFTQIGTQYFETDARGFTTASRKIESIKDKFEAQYRICLDSPRFFNTEKVRTDFSKSIYEYKKNVNEILNNISNSDVFAVKKIEFSLFPSVYAEKPRPLFINDEISEDAYIDFKKGKLKTKQKEYDLPELFKKEGAKSNTVKVVGVGEDSTYGQAKENALYSFTVNLEEELKEFVMAKDSTIDSMKLYKIVNQGKEILTGSDLEIKETAVKGDKYYYLVLKSFNKNQIEAAIKNSLLDAGVKEGSKPLLLGKRKLPLKIESKHINSDDIKITNSASFKTEQNGTKWYDFSMFINCDEATLNKIKKVTYNMHSSFRNPKVIKTNRLQNFKHQWVGWGVFNLKAEVEFNDGSVKTINHMLTF